eukprot:SAG22_NODE_1328_length_4724_cov_8.803243_4_plen_305_part_00
MGLYYPQAVTLETGPTHIIARSQVRRRTSCRPLFSPRFLVLYFHWPFHCCMPFQSSSRHRPVGRPVGRSAQFIADFNPGYLAPEVVHGILPSRAPYEGDYHGVIRGAGSSSNMPEHAAVPVAYGVSRKIVVPAGTLVIMFYDLWHRASPHGMPSDLHIPPAQRDRSSHRYMCKFRFWRMEEPAGPAWPPSQSLPSSSMPAAAAAAAAEAAGMAEWAPQYDEPQPASRHHMDPVGRALYAWLGGHAAPAPALDLYPEPTEVRSKALSFCCVSTAFRFKAVPFRAVPLDRPGARRPIDLARRVLVL